MLRNKLAALALSVVMFSACDTAGTDAMNTAANDASAAASNAAAAAASAVQATAAKAEPDERMVNAVKSRKAVLTVLKDNFVPLALMAMGRIDYNADAAQKYAQRLPVLIGMMEERFATDTRGSGVETEALDVIWEDMDGFKGKISDAMEAATKLAAVAGDKTQFEGAVKSLRDRCGACHDDYRVDTD